MTEGIQEFSDILTGMQWSDYLDIIVVAFLVYKLLPLLRTPNVLRIVRTVVALFIIYSGITLVKETVSPLLGEKPDPMLISEISDMALSYDGVLGIHDLVVHNYGPGKIFVSIHIEVDADGDLMESHDLIDNIERDISKKLHVVMTAHMDPILRNDPLTDRFNVLMRETAEKYEGIGNLHDLRVVKGPTHTNIIFDVVVKPGCALSHEELKEIFQKAADGEGENYYVVINFDNDYAGL